MPTCFTSTPQIQIYEKLSTRDNVCIGDKKEEKKPMGVLDMH